MNCQRYDGTATRKIGLGLLAWASVVVALAAAAPAAGAVHAHGRETPRPQESVLRPARLERDAAGPGLTASNATRNRGTQQVSINVANGGTGIQNAMCRGNRGCDIVQALGMPYAGDPPVPSPTPQAPPGAGAATRSRVAAHGGGATPRAEVVARQAADSAGGRATGTQAAKRGRAVPRPAPAPRPVPGVPISRVPVPSHR
ncbi:hypothetical protein ACQPZZ_25390 [Microbispora sp. CA-135349]|uniref:hypothetical protein n=1 Tax=Microbispora sp. CA-135349 TaxID=3239953 RepID=UPI003D8CA636